MITFIALLFNWSLISILSDHCDSYSLLVKYILRVKIIYFYSQIIQHHCRVEKPLQLSNYIQRWCCRDDHYTVFQRIQSWCRRKQMTKIKLFALSVKKIYIVMTATLYY